MDKGMDMENFSTKMEATMRASGKTIKWMAGANFSMKAES